MSIVVVKSYQGFTVDIVWGLDMSGVEVVELVRPGELDRVPPGKWAAIKDGKVVAWADSLEELRRVMEKKEYKRDEYYVIKVPSHDLLIV